MLGVPSYCYGSAQGVLGSPVLLLVLGEVLPVLSARGVAAPGCSRPERGARGGVRGRWLGDRQRRRGECLCGQLSGAGLWAKAAPGAERGSPETRESACLAVVNWRLAAGGGVVRILTPFPAAGQLVLPSSEVLRDGGVAEPVCILVGSI